MESEIESSNWRDQVLKLVDAERKQETPPDTIYNFPYYLARLKTLCNDANEDWLYNDINEPCLRSIRKIAAYALQCLERHGVMTGTNA